MSKSLKSLFDRVYVINLRTRPDRLNQFYEGLEKHHWPFRWPEVWEGVPSSSGKVPCPTGFTEGGGAFGCRQSHVGILQRCLMDDVESVLVLEDDALTNSTISKDAEEFISLVPDDWEGIMLGGQHHREPLKIQDGLVRVQYAQRTHAYGCRGRYMQDLYSRWAMATVHIDWLMNDWQSNYRVYAPERWLIGQARSQSDICGRKNAATFWNAAHHESPVVLLRVSAEVANSLREKHGFHWGYSLDNAHLDVGLGEALTRLSVNGSYEKLENWIREVQYECEQTENLICSVWHPAVTKDLLERATRCRVIEIRGSTPESVVTQYQDAIQNWSSPVQFAQKPVLLLHAPHSVVVDLRRHGFHFGHWRDEQSGIDRGLLKIMSDEAQSRERAAKLREWLDVLRSEVKGFGGIVGVWHPEIRRELLEAAGALVVECSATDVRSVLDDWRKLGTRSTG